MRLDRRLTLCARFRWRSDRIADIVVTPMEPRSCGARRPRKVSFSSTRELAVAGPRLSSETCPLTVLVPREYRPQPPVGSTARSASMADGALANAQDRCLVPVVGSSSSRRSVTGAEIWAGVDGHRSTANRPLPAKRGSASEQPESGADIR
jgi:hypothetical protein